MSRANQVDLTEVDDLADKFKKLGGNAADLDDDDEDDFETITEMELQEAPEWVSKE